MARLHRSKTDIPSRLQDRVRMASGPPRANKGSFFDVTADVPVTHGSSTSVIFEPGEHARKHKRIAYENTYRMAPEEKFKADKVRPIITRVLAQLEGKEYNADECSKLSKQFAEDIKLQVKALQFDRYKILCLVTIGQKNGQSVHVGSRFLWDDEKDTFTEETWSNRHLYAVGCVYALYYE